ncbi:4-aminobutyrate aminotransferase [Colletotrichum musicola]|uniref:4-aminobutyrate aminotransferase n=1 Tax=Colletotrichum musicola TaxID=2175873 RepID=A0A8H6NZ62_9PEZI|nr:4-aminobutyrate aminotransferase [Colletotrichum musicola]
MIRAIASRPALGSFPSTDYADLLRTGILKAAPKGLNQVFTATTGSDANETAYKAACIWKGTRERGGADFSAAELEFVMQNQAPGAKKYSIMSFQKGFHGPTGRFWAHEHWGLPSPPDMVTFSKKAQAAGFYFGDAGLRPDKPYRQFNTWMGDPVRALLFKSIYGEIEKHGLVEHTAKVGGYFFGELEKLSTKYPQHVQNLRGKDRGTFIAWDAPRRDEVIALAGQGIADIFLEVLESVSKRL